MLHLCCKVNSIVHLYSKSDYILTFQNLPLEHAVAERNILLQGGVGPHGHGTPQLAHPMIVGVYVCMHACMYWYVWVCMYVCVCVWVCMYGCVCMGMYGVGPHRLGASDDSGCVCVCVCVRVCLCVWVA
jgi:hypothetical protein